MNNLKERTINGIIWSFFESFSSRGIQLVVGVILARILTPNDFGIIGLTTIFISLSKSFTDSGLTSALIRKKTCTNNDYSTVFIFNLVIGVFLYILLIFGADYISVYFKEPQLKIILIVIGLGIVIHAFGNVQQTLLEKEMKFKKWTKISFLATLFSGVIAIIMALTGAGIWSLVFLFLVNSSLQTLLLWISSKWKPTWLFDKLSFKELFGFGRNLLFSSLIGSIYNNSFRFIIGKAFSIEQLGFFDRANRFQVLISENFASIINRVSYPSLSQIEDKMRLKNALKKLVKNTMFITFLAMFGLAAVAKPFILVLIGEKWLPSVKLLQLLVFAGVLYPLHIINLNLLKVFGRSDLFLKLEFIKKGIAIPMLIVAVSISIKAMIGSMIILSILEIFINGYWTSKLINYTVKEQLLDILPSFLLAAVMGGIVYFAGIYIGNNNLLTLISQVAIGVLFVIAHGEFFKLETYFNLRNILLKKLKINA